MREPGPGLAIAETYARKSTAVVIAALSGERGGSVRGAQSGESVRLGANPRCW